MPYEVGQQATRRVDEGPGRGVIAAVLRHGSTTN